MKEEPPLTAVLINKEKKKETKNPPLLYNLAELQNDCSKLFKISPDETLKVVQELYERKVGHLPQNRRQSSFHSRGKGDREEYRRPAKLRPHGAFAAQILAGSAYKTIGKTRYVNDKQITDHYAIIPTGQGLGALKGLPPLSEKVYQLICRRFLSIFYPAAVYQKFSLEMERRKEHFFASFKVLEEPGYLTVADANLSKKPPVEEEGQGAEEKEEDAKAGKQKNAQDPALLLQMLAKLKKGDNLP